MLHTAPNSKQKHIHIFKISLFLCWIAKKYDFTLGNIRQTTTE